MKPHQRIALRYIFAKRSFNFITIINIISLIGIIIGVAALIIVNSIFYGFQQLTEKQMVGFDPHLIIYESDELEINDILHFLQAKSYCLTAEIAYESRAVIIKRNKIFAVNSKLVPFAAKEHLAPLYNNMIIGDFSSKNANGIVLGTTLASSLNLLPGDTVQIVSPAHLEKSFRSFSPFAGMNFTISGIYRTSIRDYDKSYIFADTSMMMPLYGNSVKRSIEVRLNDISNVNFAKSDIISAFPSLQIVSWIDLNRDMFNIMRLERLSSFIVLSLIVVIAAFNVLASLNMTVVEKTSDIGVLKAMGASSCMIGKIFFWEGMIIGLGGTIGGTLLGLALSYSQIYFKLFAVDPTKYVVDAIPLVINYYDVIIVIVISLLLSALATIYPARRAARTIIVNAIKSE